MTANSVTEKLQVLLPHWIEHNRSHGAEFGKWAATARNEGMSEAAGLIEQAVKVLEGVDSLLSQALAQVGGPAGGHHHHHHHHD